jgi:hypothetical protein
MWWSDLVVTAVLLLGIYAFVRLVLFRARMMSRKTDRRREDTYDNYRDRRHGWFFGKSPERH